MMPMARLGLRCFWKEAGSISAPARKVRIMEPKAARTSIQGAEMEAQEVPCQRHPRKISTRATEMPMRMEMRLANNATPSQLAAVNHTCSTLILLIPESERQ